jgi:hypothetical protein
MFGTYYSTPILLCQPRCTWVFALPDSTRWIFLSKNKNNFFQKYFSLQNFFFSKNPFFQKNRFSRTLKIPPLLLSALIRLYAVHNSLIFFFSKKMSLSRDKATELSQVERSPTCIGADTGRRDQCKTDK